MAIEKPQKLSNYNGQFSDKDKSKMSSYITDIDKDIKNIIQYNIDTSQIPSQTGNSNKFLITDGTDLSWSDGISTFGTASANGILEAETSGSITCDTTFLCSSVKLGRIVHVSGQVSVSAVSSPTGNLRIILPFVVSSTSVYAAAGSCILSGIGLPASTVWVNCKAEPGLSRLLVVGSKDNTSVANVAASSVSSGDNVIFQCTYVTD